MSKGNVIVPIIMGSEKDYDFANRIGKKLREFGVPCEYRVASGHKTPKYLLQMVAEYDEGHDLVVYETVAGRSNALSGVVAANTDNPVIACPPDTDKMALMTDIWSSLRMPSNVPVMTVLGPENAALAAVRMLSLYDTKLCKKLAEYKCDVTENIISADKKLKSE